MARVKKITKKEKKPRLEKKEKVKKIAPIKEEIKEEKEIKKVAPTAQFYEAIGRRKTAIARIRLSTKGDRVFLINGKPYQNYFSTLELQQITLSPLEKMNCTDKFGISVKARGGGIHAQAEAVRHGISRALVLFNADFRKRLKKAGFLTRDARMRERKKFGLKRARKAPQWQKR